MSYLFRKRMNNIGSNYADALRNQSVNIKEAKFEEHLGFKTVTVNGLSYDAHFLESTGFTANGNKGSYYIEFRNNIEFPMGTYVYIPNTDNIFEPWLITSKSDNVLFKKESIEKCNHLLKWQYGANNTIIERYCVIRRPYSATVDHTRYLDYSSKEYQIILPLDEDTKKLHVDNRLLLDQSNGVALTYTITSFDSVSEAFSSTETVLILNVKQSASTKKDNLNQMIADYVDPTTNSHIQGDDFVRIGGTGTVFTASAKDEDGNLVTPQWEITSSDVNQDNCSVEHLSESQIKIIVSNDAKLIGKIFVLTANFPALGISDKKIIKVVGII